ncbi:MAG: DegV family protein [Deltaproteobacteria bacterium]|nr:DegV family protein [Deltaproteobacteria bacterium]
MNRLLDAAFLAGAADLMRRAPLLDRINVFPVVDADTGRNMAATVSKAARLLEEPGATARDLSRVLLLSAKGNSGVILSQFLLGFFDALGDPSRLTPATVRDGVARGRDLAYKAVAEPREGTILTVMTDLARILGELDGVPDIGSHAELERRLAASVAATPALLPRLAAAGVVDSGALGFHVLACGLMLVLPGLRAPEAALARMERRRLGEDQAPLGRIAERIDPAFITDEGTEASVARFCMDLVIETDGEAFDDWRAAFDGIGASLDAVRLERLLKLHVHCDDPEAVRRVAANLGQVIESSAEDMAEGLRRASCESAGDDLAYARLRVAGDSSMSLPRDVATSLGVPRLENSVSAHGEMVRDCDLDMGLVFSRMREGHVYKTAQASQAEARAFLDAQLSACGHLVYLAVGRAYTGTQELVRRAAADHKERNRITILDTRAASGQQGIAVLATARFAARASDVDDLVAYAERQIASAREYLVIDSLGHLKRGGRIGRVKAALAGALSIRPIVGHGGDGAITYAKARSHEAALDEVARRVASHLGDGPLLVMVEYTDNAEWAETVRERLASVLPAGTEIILSPLSATAAVHMGPGTWGVAVTRPE